MRHQRAHRTYNEIDTTNAQKQWISFAFWLLRDGPLEKLWGGGRGIFEPQEFFFVIKFLV